MSTTATGNLEKKEKRRGGRQKERHRKERQREGGQRKIEISRMSGKVTKRQKEVGCGQAERDKTLIMY